MMGLKEKLAATIVILTAALAAAQMSGPRGPSVTMAAPPLLTIPQGGRGNVPLDFRVVQGFHINSNTPHSEFLIPTALKFDTPTDIVLGKISYPAGRDMSFPFAPDEKLNVYSGDFRIVLSVRPLHTVVPGKYAFHGQLKYQACDNAQCYPPKQLPVNFEVKVAKGTPASGRRNPAQSPHAHR
jgi:Disulphide bond corrector protein DsbC